MKKRELKLEEKVEMPLCALETDQEILEGPPPLKRRKITLVVNLD